MMIKNLSIVALLSFICSFAIGQVMVGDAPKPENTTPTTTIKFDESTYEFGTIMDGEKVKHTYTYTNTGSEPLVITNAKGSCGCTVPTWSKEPLLPGETGEILVQFDSKRKGKVGGNLQSKRITITANTDPANTYLTIKGIVDKPEEVNYGDVIEKIGTPVDIKFEEKEKTEEKKIGKKKKN